MTPAQPEPQPQPQPELRRLVGRIQRHSATRFLAFSALGFAFDITLLVLLDRYTPLPDLVSVTIAFAATYAVNFMLNRWFAFRAQHDAVAGQLVRFLPQVTADYLLVVAGVGALLALGVPLLPARVLSAATNAVLNYCAYRWWTFRGAGEAAGSPQPVAAPSP